VTRPPKLSQATSKIAGKQRQAPEGKARTARQARRARRHDLTRQEILDAARRLLLRGGIAGTTLEAVAREAGMSKAALYYYFPSKNALMFELVFGVLERHAQAVHDAVENTEGSEALGAIIRQSVKLFAPNLNDFRLAFLHGQVAGEGAVHFEEDQFARIRPLNDLWFAGAAEKLREERQESEAGSAGAAVEPRLMAFLAWIAAIGLLTVKGAVESLEDPLLYTDDQLAEGLARIFEAAAGR
jgi:AcrR family transcriptional regulator